MGTPKDKIPTDLPEINRPVLSRSKRLISDDISPDLSKIYREPGTKKISSTKEPLGICYKKIDCKIPFLENVTKRQCKDAGGKSWKGKECKNLEPKNLPL
jgi:hypothetical protein